MDSISTETESLESAIALSLSLLLILSLIIWFSSLQFPDALDLASTAYIPIHVSSLSLSLSRENEKWKYIFVCENGNVYV